MDKERIEQIRVLGDNLADYIADENDRGFFRQFYTERRYDYLRTALLRANLTAVRHGHAPLVELDPYIAVFEEGDELASSDWRLARDLLLIRMVEQLYKKGWLGRNVEAIPEAVTEESEAEGEAT